MISVANPPLNSAVNDALGEQQHGEDQKRLKKKNDRTPYYKKARQVQIPPKKKAAEDSDKDEILSEKSEDEDQIPPSNMETSKKERLENHSQKIAPLMILTK